MINEQREALDRLNKDKKCSLDFKRYITIVRVADLDTVLSLVKEQEKEIDLMADFISKLDIEENICMQNKTNPDLCNVDYTNCKDCIKQYFERKVEDVKDKR